MEKTFHMLLYRAAHAERNYLRPYLAAIGLEVGQPKILGFNGKKRADHSPSQREQPPVQSSGANRQGAGGLSYMEEPLPGARGHYAPRLYSGGADTVCFVSLPGIS